MIKIYYYNIHFWRAEVLRAGLFLQNIPFENITDKEKLMEMKPKAPFAAFPILETDDGKILSQTQAMASYVGKVGSVYDYSGNGDGDGAASTSADEKYPRLYPADDDYFGQAKCDEIINGCTDVTNTIGSTFSIPKEEVEGKRKEMIKADGGRLHLHLTGLNTIVGGDGYACGDNNGESESKSSMTVADICVWRLISWLSSGKLDHIPTDFVSSNFGNLQKIHDNVETNDKIVEYMKLYY